MKRMSRSRSRVGESPFWSAAENRLYWSDLRGQQIRWIAGDGSAPEGAIACPQPVAAPIPVAGGALAVLLARGLAGRSLDTATLRAPADLPATHRFNDATVDPDGRLIAGTMLERPHTEGPGGRLYAFDGSGWRCLAEGFRTINGLAFSRDGGRLYVSDSHAEVSRVWIGDYDRRRGTLGPLRLFVALDPAGGRPDGAAVDAEGGYWIAAVGGGRILRFDAEGRQTHAIATPVRYPTKVAFGGADLRTLYVTSMIAPDPAAASADDGALFACPAPVAGWPVPALAPAVLPPPSDGQPARVG